MNRNRFSIQCGSCGALVRVGLDFFGRIDPGATDSCTCGRVHANEGVVNFSNGIKVVGKSR